MLDMTSGMGLKVKRLLIRIKKRVYAGSMR